MLQVRSAHHDPKRDLKAAEMPLELTIVGSCFPLMFLISIFSFPRSSQANKNKSQFTFFPCLCTLDIVLFYRF